MSVKVFKSVVHEDAQPKRVNNFLPVKPRGATPAEKASPRFVDIFERALAKKLEQKYNTASANRPTVFQSVLAREKPTAKKT